MAAYAIEPLWAERPLCHRPILTWGAMLTWVCWPALWRVARPSQRLLGVEGSACQGQGCRLGGGVGMGLLDSCQLALGSFCVSLVSVHPLLGAELTSTDSGPGLKLLGS